MERVWKHSRKSVFFVALAALFYALLSIWAARPVLADKFNTETSSDVRSLGMGNATINSSRGGYSVFYNPANIAAKDTGSHVQLINFQVEGNQGMIQQGFKAKSLNFLSLSSLFDTLRTQPNTYVGGRFSLYPNITLRGFSLGMLYEVNQAAEVRASDGALRVFSRNRFSPTAAFSLRAFNGIFRIGASAQLLTVGDSNKVITPPINTSTLDFKTHTKSGSGLATTAGMTITIPLRFLPSFSVVLRNIGGTKFSGSPLIPFGSAGTPDPQDMTLDFASSLTVYLARRLEMKAEFDYRDIYQRLGGQKLRRAFIGTEFILYDLIKFRAGLAHGYWTAGFGIGNSRASLDFAAYSEERNDYLRGSQDQRFVMQYTWEIFK